MTTAQTAVALFTRSPVAGSAKSRLRVQQSPIQNIQELHTALVSGSIDEMSLLGSPETHIFWAPDSANTTSTPFPCSLQPVRARQHWQRGASFARRFSNMLFDLQQQGPRGVLVIGSDCPYLRASHLACAVDHLHLGTPCFGPAPRGGLYLLGIPADSTPPDWEKFFAAEDQHAAFNQAFPGAVRLEELADIDVPQDLHQLLKACPQRIQKPVSDFLATQPAALLPPTQN